LLDNWELRFSWNGDLRALQIFKSWAELETGSEEKPEELEAQGMEGVGRN
jgi:hypothetical protein